LFEFLILEGAQAGLSWLTILKKRENYFCAFDGFAVEKVARYGEQDVARLLDNPGIVRNRLKVASAIRNAKAVLAIAQEFGSLDTYLWQFVDGTPIQNSWKTMQQIPVSTPESDRMSQDLKRRGLNFVGHIRREMKQVRTKHWPGRDPLAFQKDLNPSIAMIPSAP